MLLFSDLTPPCAARRPTNQISSAQLLLRGKEKTHMKELI